VVATTTAIVFVQDRLAPPTGVCGVDEHSFSPPDQEVVAGVEPHGVADVGNLIGVFIPE